MTWICNNNTVFLHIPKCGGNSVMHFMPGKLYSKDWLHQTRSEIDTDLPVWTIVRHPADRIISYWVYIQNRLRIVPPLRETHRYNLPENLNNLYSFITVFNEMSMTDYIQPGVDNWYKLEEIEKVFPNFPIHNTTRRNNWQYYLRGQEECVTLIKEKYKQDFKNFNYSTDFTA